MTGMTTRIDGRTGRAVGILALLIVMFAVRSACAHDLEFTGADLRLEEDGRFALVVTCHPDAVYAGRGPQDSVPDSAYERFSGMDAEWKSARRSFLVDYFGERAVVLFDGVAVATAVSFPDEGNDETRSLVDGKWFGYRVTLSGRVPMGAARLAVRLAPEFSPVRLTISLSGSAESTVQTLVGGETSSTIALAQARQVRPQSMGQVTWRYLVLGYTHILPEGLDHILFVVGLFLLSQKMSALLWQISAFTVAHTITLALASLGIVRLSSGIVEPLIALSIAYVGIENLCTKRLMPWRPAVVFGFGLLHGMGFAGVLTTIGLPEDQFVPALVSFNVGVEIGQLSVITGALLIVGWWRNRKWYRARIVIPGSAGVALMGLFWAAQRTFF